MIVRRKELAGLRHSSRRYTPNPDGAGNHNAKVRKSMMIRTQKVKTQCFLYAGAFFTVWTFPTIARFIQLLGGTIHPIIGVLAGTFIGCQGFLNAIIYFRPRYQLIERHGFLAKVCELIAMTLFFCCYDGNRVRGSKYDSDYMSPPNNISSRGSSNHAGSVRVIDSNSTPKARGEETPPVKANSTDDKIGEQDVEGGARSSLGHTVVSFQTEPTTKIDEFAENHPSDNGNIEQ